MISRSAAGLKSARGLATASGMGGCESTLRSSSVRVSSQKGTMPVISS